MASTKTNAPALRVTGLEDAQHNETSKQHKMPHQNSKSHAASKNIYNNNIKITDVRETLAMAGDH